MNNENNGIKYKQIKWVRYGEYEHYGYLGLDDFVFFRILYVPGIIMKCTIERLVCIGYDNIKKNFDSLDEAKKYCQDVFVPRMAAIFVNGCEEREVN